MQLLKKPYPYAGYGPKYWLGLNALCGLIVSLCIFFIVTAQGEKLSRPLIINCLLFGAVTFIVMDFLTILLPLVFKHYFSEQRWTLGKNIFISVLMLLVITICNTLLGGQLYGYPFSVKALLHFLYYTLGIGLVVNSFISVINYKRLLKKHLATADTINKEMQHEPVTNTMGSAQITLASEAGKESFVFSLDELLYIEAADNYTKVFCIKESRLQDRMLRSTLKRIELQLPYPQVFRCHRSFLVNLVKVKSVSGNAQGYQLSLEGTEKLVPVSRSAGKSLQARLKNIHQLE